MPYRDTHDSRSTTEIPTRPEAPLPTPQDILRRLYTEKPGTEPSTVPSYETIVPSHLHQFPIEPYVPETKETRPISPDQSAYAAHPDVFSVHIPPMPEHSRSDTQRRATEASNNRISDQSAATENILKAYRQALNLLTPTEQTYYHAYKQKDNRIRDTGVQEPFTQNEERAYAQFNDYYDQLRRYFHPKELPSATTEDSAYRQACNSLTSTERANFLSYRRKVNKFRDTGIQESFADKEREAYNTFTRHYDRIRKQGQRETPSKQEAPSKKYRLQIANEAAQRATGSSRQYSWMNTKC